jgi:ATP/maltotriose-dependent transcriptional regulator MalT
MDDRMDDLLANLLRGLEASGATAGPALEESKRLGWQLWALLDDEDLCKCLSAALYWPLYEALLDAGVDGRTASHLALRQAQLVRLLLFGYSQREAARELKVSEGTAKLDAQAIRAALPSVRAAASRDLPPVPVPEDARVKPLRPPARARAGSR